MESPLNCSIRPQHLRVRLPVHAIGYFPAARAMRWRAACRGVWRVARGKTVEVES